jgi:hypothetical protein
MHRLALIAVAGALAAAPLATFAATFTVTNANDSGAGSLRQAIIDANATPSPPHTIVFGAAYPLAAAITLQSPLPLLANGQISIIGNNRNPAIDGASAHPILVAGAGSQSVSISGIRFRNGARAAGGGCLALAVDDSPRSLAVSTSSFTNCRATAPANPRGGAILWRPGAGSAVTIGNSEFIDNRTVATAPPLGQAGAGGAVFVEASIITIEGNRFQSNFLDVGSSTAGGLGGAARILNRGGFAGIQGNEFRFNSATPLANDGFGLGGAVSFECAGTIDCAFEFARNYFRGNSGQSGGAIASSAQAGPPAARTQANFLDNTFVNNSVINAGGAIFLFNLKAGLVHNSFFGNDGGISGHLWILNTIQLRVASNLLAATNNGPACLASGNQVDFLSGFSNLSRTPCSIASGHDFQVYAAMPTPAIDENGPGVLRFDGDPVIVDGVGQQADAFCTATDIRGTPRPVDGDGDGVARCDIGSFEHPAELVFRNGFESTAP